MSAAPGASHISSKAPNADPRYNAAGYWDPFHTSGAGGGPRPAGQNAINPTAGVPSGITNSGGSTAAAPVARTPTPQETANTKYMPQLDAQMAKDPSNGYADQLKTLMTTILPERSELCLEISTRTAGSRAECGGEGIASIRKCRD